MKMYTTPYKCTNLHESAHFWPGFTYSLQNRKNCFEAFLLKIISRKISLEWSLIIPTNNWYFTHPDAAHPCSKSLHSRNLSTFAIRLCEASAAQHRLHFRHSVMRPHFYPNSTLPFDYVIFVSSIPMPTVVQPAPSASESMDSTTKYNNIEHQSNHNI